MSTAARVPGRPERVRTSASFLGVLNSHGPAGQQSWPDAHTEDVGVYLNLIYDYTEEGIKKQVTKDQLANLVKKNNEQRLKELLRKVVAHNNRVWCHFYPPLDDNSFTSLELDEKTGTDQPVPPNITEHWSGLEKPTIAVACAELKTWLNKNCDGDASWVISKQNEPDGATKSAIAMATYIQKNVVRKGTKAPPLPLGWVEWERWYEHDKVKAAILKGGRPKVGVKTISGPTLRNWKKKILRSVAYRDNATQHVLNAWIEFLELHADRPVNEQDEYTEVANMDDEMLKQKLFESEQLYKTWNEYTDGTRTLGALSDSAAPAPATAPEPAPAAAPAAAPEREDEYLDIVLPADTDSRIVALFEYLRSQRTTQ
jgi:hypothetical protein